MKPSDRVPAWPEQSAVMRVSNSCVLLQAILPEALYMQVRKEVFEWDLRNDPAEAANTNKRALGLVRFAK